MKRYIATTVLALAAFGAQAKDIVDTAIAAGQFNTLAAALDKAGLVATLKGKGPFTVFAPTDAAFAKLPKRPTSTLCSPTTPSWLPCLRTTSCPATSWPKTSSPVR